MRRIGWLGFTAFFAAGSLMAGGNKPEGQIRRCKRAWIGVPAPDLRSLEQVAGALRGKVNFPLWWWHRHVSSYFSTPFKRLGIFGWSDYCSEACAEGTTIQADKSQHSFYTVDVALSGFYVQGIEASLHGPRFLRVEMHGRINKELPRLPQKSDVVRICGKLMWDGDGFLEVHPRSAEDVKLGVPF